MSKQFKVDAFCYGIDPRPNWFDDKVTSNEILTFIDKIDVVNPRYYHCLIKSESGNQEAKYGDYIIRGVNGSVHAISAKLFHLTYNTEKYTPPKDMIYLKIDQAEFDHKMESKLLSWQYLKMKINMMLWK